jgi:NTE family protein
MAEEQLTALQARAQVQVITPDEDSIGAFGTNPLDPDVRAPCAHAGYAQGSGIDFTLGVAGS